LVVGCWFRYAELGSASSDENKYII